MKQRSARLPAKAQQAVLDELEIRLIRPEERTRYDQLIEQQHYLKNADLVGEQLRYVAVDSGDHWLALLSWSAPAYRLRAREAWIGWTPWQREQRRHLLANNSRFLILPEGRFPNLATRAMRLCLDRLSADWQVAYGHPLVIVETFVDPALFAGTVYRAGGWEEIGVTQGHRRCSRDFYQMHERPKRLFVRTLVPDARAGLCAPTLPASWHAGALPAPPGDSVPISALRSLYERFHALPDTRRHRSHQQAGLLALIACAALCGVARGQRDLAAFARDCTQAQLRALRCRRDPRTRLYQPPSESSFFRVLQRLDPRQIETVLLGWQQQMLGPLEPGELISVDGKELCSAAGLELVSAYAASTGRWLGSEPVASGSNEIPAARRLLDRVPIDGHPVVADALHTNQSFAHQVVQERGGDYVLTVKANHDRLHQTLCHKLAPQSFSPSRRIHHPDRGTQRRPL
jgi:hypothetical protein